MSAHGQRFWTFPHFRPHILCSPLSDHTADGGESHLLEDVSVELLLPIAQKFSDHLPAQSLPLKQEVSHADRCVGDESPLSQVLDALLWLPDKFNT